MPNPNRDFSGLDPVLEEDYEAAAAEESEDEDEYDDEGYEALDEEEDDEVQEYIPVTEYPRVSAREREKQRLAKSGVVDASFSTGVDSGECSQSREYDRSEIDGLFCSICMEAWTTFGDHHVCCLPCGHIYGFSCIKRWLKEGRSSSKCPQCKRKCTLKEVRKLYATRIVAIDGESKKRIQSLVAKCIFLEKESAAWRKKEAEWRKKEAEWKTRDVEIKQQVEYLEKRINYLEHSLEEVHNGTLAAVPAKRGCQVLSMGRSLGSDFSGQGTFILQKELQIEGARLFDIDTSSQILLVARRLPGIGRTFVLTKINMLPPHEREDILLPYDTKAIRDLHISPFDANLALFPSLGKKLSIISTESNNVVLAYDLPADAWSCSWDLNSSNHIFAGLQNGSLLVYDIRQTVTPIESSTGLNSKLIHTIKSLHSSKLPDGVGAILVASSIGLCHWSFSDAEEKPFLVPETDNQGSCICLAYSSSSDDIVASYRPKINFLNDVAVSQPTLTPVSGQAVQGSHVHFRRVGSNFYRKFGSVCANVNDVRLPKSTIINIDNCRSLFASGDEVTGEMILHELPSFNVYQRLKSPKLPFHDVKYTHTLNQGLLGCLSEDTLQIFSIKL